MSFKRKLCNRRAEEIFVHLVKNKASIEELAEDDLQNLKVEILALKMKAEKSIH